MARIRGGKLPLTNFTTIIERIGLDAFIERVGVDRVASSIDVRRLSLDTRKDLIRRLEQAQADDGIDPCCDAEMFHEGNSGRLAAAQVEMSAKLTIRSVSKMSSKRSFSL